MYCIMCVLYYLVIVLCMYYIMYVLYYLCIMYQLYYVLYYVCVYYVCVYYVCIVLCMYSLIACHTGPGKQWCSGQRSK